MCQNLLRIQVRSKVQRFSDIDTDWYLCSPFSRDGGLPDRGLFGRLNSYTKTPVWSVWLVIILSIAMGALSWASLIAAQAIFSMVSEGTATELILYRLTLDFLAVCCGYGSFLCDSRCLPTMVLCEFRNNT